MGDNFSLADICFAPLIARLEAIQFLGIWLDHRPATRNWWTRLKNRPSYSQAKVGPGTGEERDEFAREGKKIVDQARRMLGQYS
jgi:glutathione S-transferase